MQSIAAAGDDVGRRAAITARLDTLGLEWKTLAFDAKQRPGENLYAEVAGPAGAPLLLIGAHSDRVAVGDGATDNASGSATVLALAQRFKQRPLQHHRVAVAFWDLEEAGLLGSKAFVADGKTRPALYVNFDVFGWGDTLWMMAPTDAQATLVQGSRTASQGNRLQLVSGEQYPPTDHLPFLAAGWPAVSYSLVGRDEAALVLDAYAGKKLAQPPKVMQVIHSDRDRVDQIDAAAVARGVDAVEQALREWDAQAGAGGAVTSASGNGE
ncbi:M28 family metallopeptidase [Lysobacter sp. LF1]|uniref:M28 family metallopeptidase n=1 Tax=Lysobacter stagni TaxID=3045172 RepID=A0ABT6XI68_9GAMM|nr:M28 family peptidase [Lysobacter sp. LF1]MDI9239658.1 M28 family metallopeptidase [Lysobacter sp. LF1]